MASCSDDGDTVLDYSIHSCSSFSGDFSPEQILINNPTDPKSRWLSCDNRLPQFLILKLDEPSVLRSILFGKFEKSHPCNVRQFRIYGGMKIDQLHLLLEDGLKNNSVPEKFNLHFHQKQDEFPCQYIKIVPLQSWGYNFSIWHVQLRGIADKERVTAAAHNLSTHCEREAVRICLKHLREYDYIEAFEALRKKAKVSLEHPLLSQLHQLLVVEGDFVAVERLIQQAAEDGYMDNYISEQPINAQWKQLHPKTRTDNGDVTVSGGPSGRGGHQMCLDSTSQTIYLYGGWDGTKDLGDLWSYNIEKEVWTCLCPDTSLAGGPSGRSCHKMCLDCEDQTLYLLGQYLEQPVTAIIDLSAELKADFYSYSIREGTWTLLSSDTYQDYGPRLIFDHQMCFDQGLKTLYVFGGSILSDYYSTRDTSELRYSGLYAYFVTDHQWVCIQPDLITQPYNYPLLPRMGHSMVLDSEHHLLYVLGGKRNKEHLSDMVMYDLQSDTTTVIADGETTQIPASGFTVRTAFNSVKAEMCLFGSLSKQLGERDSRQPARNSLWTYDIKAANWKCISQGDPTPPRNSQDINVPTSRYAHQFLYNPNKNCYYLFGGSQGGGSSKSLFISMRLDDFWQLKLVSLTKWELVRHCRYIIRKQQFSELVLRSPVEAIPYLQVQLAELVNHDNKQESAEFRELASALFTPSAETMFTKDAGSDGVLPSQRNSLYRELSSYFPSHMTQPRQNITDLVKL